MLAGWPVPQKGYRYRFQVVDSDDVNAMAVPTGYVFMTRGLLESLETENEIAAVLAHKIAHVESRHSYRIWRNAQRASTIAGIVGIFAGVTNSAVDDIVATMSSFIANLFLIGHGSDAVPADRRALILAPIGFNDSSGGYPPIRLER